MMIEPFESAYLKLLIGLSFIKFEANLAVKSEKRPIFSLKT